MNHKKTNRIFLLLLFAGINICRNFLWLIPSALMVPVTQDMHLDYNQSGQLVLVVTAVMGVMLMCSRYILKKIDPCLAILAGMICLFTDGVCSFLGTTFPVMITGKIFCGIGYGLTTFSSTALIAACFPKKQIGLANGLNTCISSLSIAMAYQFIVPINHLFDSWRTEALMWGVLSLGVAVLFFIWSSFQKDLSFEEKHPDEDSCTQKLLCHPTIKYFIVIISFLMLPYVCINSYYPTYLFQIRNFLLSTANSIVSTLSIAGMLGSLLIGGIFYRVSRFRFFLPTILFLLVMGFAGMTILPQPVLILISVITFGSCYFGITTFCTSSIMCLPDISPAAASSAVSLMSGFGSLLALAVPVIQQILTDRSGMQNAFICFGILYIPAFAAALLLSYRKSEFSS